MAIQWTSKLEKECSLTYKNEGMQAAIDKFGIGKGSILAKMARMGIISGDDKVPYRQERKYYAEDAADMLELLSCGVSQSIIAEKYNTTKKIIQTIMNKAKQKGFDAYPPRPSV